jgi:putative transcriptional regulator
MYLEGMSATVDIALRLEEFIGEPLVVPVDPLAFTPDTQRLLDIYAKLERLERSVFVRLERLGYEVLPTIRCPFEAFTQHEETTLLTGVGEEAVEIERKAAIVSNIGRVVERDAVLFVERRVVRGTIQGVPVIGRDELRRAKDLESVEELISKRKG